jgi:hypothetical protein
VVTAEFQCRWHIPAWQQKNPAKNLRPQFGNLIRYQFGAQHLRQIYFPTADEHQKVAAVGHGRAEVIAWLLTHSLLTLKN